jgi:hypothetical protein
VTTRGKRAALGLVLLAILAGFAIFASTWVGSGGGSGAGSEGLAAVDSDADALRPAGITGARPGDGGTPARAVVSPDPGGASPPRGAPDSPRRVVARSEWGSRPGQLGRERPDEANPEAPMSLTGGPGGTVLVLDQVNGRIARFGPDGQPLPGFPLGVDLPQDLAVAPDGTIAVLDRLASRRVAILGPDGREVGSLPLEGEGIPETGAVTGVFVDEGDVYVERENGPLVRIGTLGGEEGDRLEIPGRPSRDGRSYLMAGLVEPPAGRFFVNAIARPDRQHRFTRDITVPLTLRQILLLDTDMAGVIYVAVAGTPWGASEEVEEVRLLCLLPSDGSTLGFAILPPNLDPDETLREMTVLDGGGVLYAVRSDAGMSIELYDCRSGA